MDRSKAPRTYGFGQVRMEPVEPVVLPRSGVTANIIGGGSDDLNMVSLYVAGGRLLQPASPVAALTATLVPCGSATRSAGDVAEALDYHGSWKSEQVSDFYIEHSLYSLGGHLEHTLPVMVDCLANASFAAADFERVKTRTATNVAVRRQKVRKRAMARLAQLYWGENHPLAADPTPEQVLAIDRDVVVDYYKQYYRRNNLRVVLAGRIDDKMVDLVDRVLADMLPPDALPPAQRPVVPRRPADDRDVVIEMPDSSQAAVAMTLDGVPRAHPDYLALRVAVMALGGYFGSRLMSNIREDKGLCYDIQAYLSGRAGDGHVTIVTECNADSVDVVVGEIHRELRRLATRPMSRAELESVRQHMLSELARTLDTPFYIASQVAAEWLYGIYPEYFNRQVEVVKNITPAELRTIAARYFTPHTLRSVVVG